MDHQPVLLHEALQHLAIQPNGIYIDGTFGRGGHASAILAQLGPDGRLLAFDKDPAAVAAAKVSSLSADMRFSIVHGSYTLMRQVAEQRDWLGKVNGILLDLGVSSPQLDEAQRGFSFLRDGPLDMRMDTTQTLTAAHWVNHATQQELRQAFFTYGEERYATRIAAAICTARTQTPITTTQQLANIIAQAHPRWEHHKHPATRVFQAIRIVINRELEELPAALEQCLDVLSCGGRLAVISFHSLEDRIVTNFIRTHATTAQLPKGLALTQAAIAMHLRIKRINKAIRPNNMELTSNPRARSATLRIMEKIQ